MSDMFYFPFVELIERLIAWAKNFGSPIFWIWILLIGIPAGISGSTWKDGGDLPIYSLFVALGIWIFGAYPVYLYEKSRDKKCANGKWRDK